MTREITAAEGIVEGMLAALGHKPTEADLIDCLRSERVQKMELPESTCDDLVKAMIAKGFGGCAESFILALSEHLRIHPPVNENRVISIQAILTAANAIHDDLFQRNSLRGEHTLKALMTARSMFTANRGRISHILRACAKALDIERVDKYAESLPEYEKEVRDILAGGILERLGFWKIWCLVRRLFIGKNPETAGAEMEREKEIAIVHAQLEELWRYPINLDDPNLEERMTREAELIARLGEIDPDNSTSWFEGNAPSDRRAD